jgi:glycosyltransferase involved in cell wall biosynthesis
MAEKRWLNKIFFLLESKKLKRYEDRVLAQQGISILAISEKDQNYLKGKFGNSHFVGAFHSFTEVVSQIGRGNFAFYHGKLDVAENNEAAIFLVNEVFSKVDYPLIIAGANPSAELVKVVSQLKHVQIKSDLNTAEIHTLLKDAQINVLPTFQSTGVKLKLLSALFSGRFCLVNDMMVAGTSLQGFCRIANSTEEWIAAIDELREKEFSVQHIAERKQIEGSSFSNEANAKNLYALLFPSS